jgi:hypothetical protein
MRYTSGESTEGPRRHRWPVAYREGMLGLRLMLPRVPLGAYMTVHDQETCSWPIGCTCIPMFTAPLTRC